MILKVLSAVISIGWHGMNYLSICSVLSVKLFFSVLNVKKNALHS